MSIAADRKRIAYIDIARCFAILSISLNHAINKSFSIYSRVSLEYASIPFALTVVKSMLYVLSRIGVPFFLMITGALMLGRDYSGDRIRRFVKHNWLPLLITTEIWLAIMFWFLQIFPGSILRTEGLAYCLSSFVKTLFFLDQVTLGSMWYMPMILCVYLMIPIMSMALRTIPHRYFLLPLGIAVISSMLLVEVNAAWKELGLETLSFELRSMHLFSHYMIYVLFGFAVQQGYLRRFKSGMLLLVSVACFLIACVYQIWFYSRGSSFIIGRDYDSILLLLISAPAFELLHRKEEAGMRSHKLAVRLADMAFGIYFIHRIIIEGVNELMNEHLPSVVHLPKVLFLWLFSVLASIAIIRLFGRNEWIRRYVFGMKGEAWKAKGG